MSDYSVNPPNVYGFGHQAYYEHVIDCIVTVTSSSWSTTWRERKSLELISAIPTSPSRRKRRGAAAGFARPAAASACAIERRQLRAHRRRRRCNQVATLPSSSPPTSTATRLVTTCSSARWSRSEGRVGRCALASPVPLLRLRAGGDRRGLRGGARRGVHQRYLRQRRAGARTARAVNASHAHRCADVAIGSNATILPVQICDDVIIGAGAVVTRSITRPSVYAGSPARLLRPLKSGAGCRARHDARPRGSVPLADLYAQYLAIPRGGRCRSGGGAYVPRPLSAVRSSRRSSAEFAGRVRAAARGLLRHNGTDALYIAMRATDVGPGDEVIVPAHSWISTSATVTQAGGAVACSAIRTRTPSRSIPACWKASSRRAPSASFRCTLYRTTPPTHGRHHAYRSPRVIACGSSRRLRAGAHLAASTIATSVPSGRWRYHSPSIRARTSAPLENAGANVATGDAALAEAHGDLQRHRALRKGITSGRRYHQADMAGRTAGGVTVDEAPPPDALDRAAPRDRR